jgi:hypothetical protein
VNNDIVKERKTGRQRERLRVFKTLFYNRSLQIFSGQVKVAKLPQASYGWAQTFEHSKLQTYSVLRSNLIFT